MVITLASSLVVVSAVIFLLDRTSHRDLPESPGASALLWAHVWCLMASAGLELGKVLPFWVSAPLVVSGALWSLLFGYIGLEAAFSRRSPSWTWAKAGFALAVLQAAIAIVSQSINAIFVSSSLLNGFLAFYFGCRLWSEGRSIGVKATWLYVFPFAAISLAYFGRLALVVFGAPEQIVVAAAVGIGLVFPVATMFWVFGSMSLRSFHLTTDLDHAAHFDALTGLRNRASLDAFQSSLPAFERRVSGRFSMCLCIDLDLFKEINDTYGHAAGDAVLSAVADRMLSVACHDDRIFRIGGDEFVFWRECRAEDSPENFAEEMLTAICQPVYYAGIQIMVGASMGYETSSDDASPWTLVRRADIALYASKAKGRNQVTAYSEELGADYDHRLHLLSDFQQAVVAGEIGVEFQAQIDRHCQKESS